jgi:hypothetical protein
MGAGLVRVGTVELTVDGVCLANGMRRARTQRHVMTECEGGRLSDHL